jgi:hypothetical protein
LGNVFIPDVFAILQQMFLKLVSLATAKSRRCGAGFATVIQRTDGGLDAWHADDVTTSKWSTIMGKYFLAWILGVPAVVLLLIYLFFH